jgi:hypothetical protein
VQDGAELWVRCAAVTGSVAGFNEQGVSSEGKAIFAHKLGMSHIYWFVVD